MAAIDLCDDTQVALTHGRVQRYHEAKAALRQGLLQPEDVLEILPNPQQVQLAVRALLLRDLAEFRKAFQAEQQRLAVEEDRRLKAAAAKLKRDEENNQTFLARQGMQTMSQAEWAAEERLRNLAFRGPRDE